MSKSGRPPNIVISNTVSPDQVDKLRLRVYNSVARHLSAADQVIQGKKKWDQVQLRLFLSMMDKVMPTLTHSHKTIEDVRKPLDQYTNEELLELLERASIAKAIEAEVVDVTPPSAPIVPTAPITMTELAEIEAREREIRE